MSIFLLQEATDMTWNYVILAILIVIAAILGYRVISKKKKED